MGEKKKLPKYYELSGTAFDTFFPTSGDDLSKGILAILAMPLLPFLFMIALMETVALPAVFIARAYLKTFKKDQYDHEET